MEPPDFSLVEPEAAGVPERGPANAVAPVVFDGWMGDSLIRSYPLLSATTDLKSALLGVSGGTGFGVRRARVRTSRFYRRHHAGERLPAFFSIEVTGRPGHDDIGLTADGSLIVSRRVLDVLLQFQVKRATFAQYGNGDTARRRAGRRS
jgi:hypothetical protein